MILETALMCMAVNIYHESKFQSMVGQLAVGQVVMNRVADTRFPDSVCEVVKQAVTHKGTDKPILHKCQFSWWCNGAPDTPDLESDEWYNAKRYARMVLYGTITLDITEGATHYHATYVRPEWAKTKTKTTRIDRHIFYRWEK
jgi:N-acetylmuramoyl-L-alanine amidase